ALVAALPSADVGFVNFDDSAEWHYGAFGHDFTNAMIQVPRGFVSADPQVALQLLRADSFFGIQHENDSLEPHYQRQMRIVEDRARGRRELLTAISIAADVQPLPLILFLGIPSLGAALFGGLCGAFVFLYLAVSA